MTFREVIFELTEFQQGSIEKRSHHEHCIYHPSRNLTDFRWYNIARQYWHPIRHIHRPNRHRHYQEPRIAFFYHVLHSASHFSTSY